VSRCGCSRSDFSTPRDRGGASIQGCHNCTSGIGDDGADPAYRTCAGRRIRTIELLDGASLSARSISLSGGYALAAGAIMIASRYLTTHTSPVADPYSRLEVPPNLGCTRTGYRLTSWTGVTSWSAAAVPSAGQT